MPEDRRLAAIMFTDIVGYTALMGSDEDRAFKLLRKNREIHKPLIKKYHGQWLKEMGDGILASFSTASDAVRCASEIQHKSKKEGVPLRIGIHEGEVVFEGSDVLGDGVNVASRLEAMAEEGCINISDAVYRNIKNKAGISAEFIEEKTLKNVDEPVKVYKVQCENGEQNSDDNKLNTPNRRYLYYISAGVIIIILFVFMWQFLPSDEATNAAKEPTIEKSIAVLPFKNLSGDDEQEYLCDGLTDEIINHLFKVKSFDKVVSLSSVLTFRDSEKLISEIAKELNVNYILEGTYKRINDQVIISANLINPKKDNQLWHNNYNQTSNEITFIQSDIAIQIATNLNAFLTDSEKMKIKADTTINTEAYELLLKANFSPNITPNRKKAKTYLERAIKIDPNFAEAYSQLGWLILYNGTYSGDRPMSEVVWFAYDYFEKAKGLNPNIALPHFGIGNIFEWTKWDYIRAEKEYLQAIEIQPNNARFKSFYWAFLLKMNRVDDASALNEYILDGNTANAALANLTLLLIRKGKKDEAIDNINNRISKIMEYDSLNILNSYEWIGGAYLHLDQSERALIYLDSAIFCNKDILELPRFLHKIALAEYRNGNQKKAQLYVDLLMEKEKKTKAGSPCFFLGYYYSGTNQIDSAFYWLEKAYNNRSPELPWLKAYKVFDNIRSDPRYLDLYERTGFKAYDDYMKSEGIAIGNSN